METGDAGVHKALAVPARRALLAALTDAAEPLDVQQLAALLGQHVTTLRHHLAALLEAGLVVAEPAAAPAGRGRPRLRYAAAPVREQLAAYQVMVDVLARGYGADRAERAERAEQAGRAWGESEETGAGPLAEQVLAEAAGWGFKPELRPSGEEIVLHGCPFQRNAESHPEVVCSVHQGLLDAIAFRAGRPGALRLHPFSGPHTCTITIEPGPRREADR
ncbi:helix-turn-helix domain-containing protein [Kitasatospora sp. NPDC002227]|uniref:helix-turn-helix transcriptional regulator n=1 Tax=Kitasatospora sp. NPDC002227 TaxID=3154773 RepID=UPI0033189D85